MKPASPRSSACGEPRGPSQVVDKTGSDHRRHREDHQDETVEQPEEERRRGLVVREAGPPLHRVGRVREYVQGRCEAVSAPGGPAVPGGQCGELSGKSEGCDDGCEC